MKAVDIKRMVNNYYHIDTDLPTRCYEVARPRQIVMYLCREYTSLSLPQISRLFPNMRGEHTTVMNACYRVKRLIGENPVIAKDILALVKIIENNAK